VIPVNPPTKEIVIEVIQGLLNGFYSREETSSWIDSMYTNYTKQYPGCFTFKVDDKDAEFVMKSLLFINDKDKADFDSPNQYFIREKDLEEYLNILNKVDCREQCGNIKRIRFHQRKLVKEVYYYIVEVECDAELIERCGVFLTRGLYDDLGEHLEYAMINYCGSQLGIQYTHGIDQIQFIVGGVSGSEKNIAKLLVELGITSEKLKWVNNDIDNGKYNLCRLDDNDNAFIMKTFNSYIAAEVARNEYEKKGHKQTYYLEQL